MSRRRRAADQPMKTMELLIAGDYTMVNYYTKEFLPTYLLTVANIVSEYRSCNEANTEQGISFNISVLIQTLLFCIHLLETFKLFMLLLKII